MFVGNAAAVKRQQKRKKEKKKLTLSRMFRKRTRPKSNAELLFSLFFYLLQALSAWIGAVLTPLLTGERGASPAPARRKRVRVCAAWGLNRKRDNRASASERRGSVSGGTQPVFCDLTDARCAIFLWRNKTRDDKPVWVQELSAAHLDFIYWWLTTQDFKNHWRFQLLFDLWTLFPKCTVLEKACQHEALGFYILKQYSI